MTAILSALKSLVDLIFLLKELVLLWKKAKAEGWLEDARKTLKAIDSAKTDEERRVLARELAKVGVFPRH